MTTFTVDSTALFTLVAIAAGVGFLVGLAMVVFRRGKKETKPPQKGLLEIAKIWRDKFDGNLWLQVEQKSGSRLDDFSGDERDQVEKIVTALAGWIDQPARPPASVPLAAVTAAVIAAEEPVVSPPPTLPLAETQQTTTQAELPPALSPSSQPQVPVQSIPSTSQNQQPANKPRIDIVKGIRLTLEGDTTSKLEKTQNRSIAAQVDEILQEKIKGTVLEKKGIRLMELPGKGMVVMVGLEQYDSLDTVPYPEVKAAIRYCVAQWEKKMLG